MKETVLNLEQKKKQARDFLQAIRSGNPDALSRLRRHHARWATVDENDVRLLVSLHDAQFALAREQGFASWPKLKAHSDPSSRSAHTRLFEVDVTWLKDRVHGLLRTRESAGPAALEQIREWHPRFSDQSDEEIRQAPFSVEDALLVYAKEHGFDTWDELAARVKALASNPAAAAAEPFRNAFIALRSGDTESFEAILRANPRPARERGTNGNTLLNLAVSFAGKPEWTGGLTVIHALLAAGSDVNEANDRGWTPLHQAAYANRSDIAAVLIQNGAALDVEAHGSGGTPLVVALFWGHRDAADLLGRDSIAPSNLRTAAGLGRLDLLDACFQQDGALTEEACAARGFYRPHSGFPEWKPSTDPQEVLDEALVWACKCGRLDVLHRLVKAGAHPNANPYRGTPLIWASVCNRLETIAWLLNHGADINQKATFGGLSHGQGITALHLAAQYGHLDVVKLLIHRGADCAIQEDLYQSTPESAANHFGQTEVRDYLKGLPAQG
jgi:ankyrin repeat protein